MEIIEKVKEVEKVPTKEYASKGVAGTGLGLGIAGTALGLLALNRGGFGLFGNNCGYGHNGMPQNVNINADVNSADGVSAPTPFQAWEKSCDDAISLTRAIYDGRITDIYGDYNTTDR